MNISCLVISRLQSVSGEIEMNIEVMRAEGDICYVTLFLVLCGCRGCAKPERRVEAVDPWPPSSQCYSRKQHISHPGLWAFPPARRTRNSTEKQASAHRRSLLNLARKCFTFHICGDRCGAAPYQSVSSQSSLNIPECSNLWPIVWICVLSPWLQRPKHAFCHLLLGGFQAVRQGKGPRKRCDIREECKETEILISWT